MILKKDADFGYKRIAFCITCTGEFRQTVVMITHNNDIARLADRIVRIEDGKIVE